MVAGKGVGDLPMGYAFGVTVMGWEQCSLIYLGGFPED